ncbi:MAG: serine/threonine-protein kinase [Planctomycetota bacterium]|jgi:serine/threonine-protein kinase
MSDDPLEAGLQAGYGKSSRAPGESVLAAIERLHGARSQVALREADDGATPVSLRRNDAPAVDDSRYQILGEVARGGVGVIYRGRDKNLNRDVALKVLRTEHAQSADVIQRFIEEAQVGGQLQHPGIVPVYGMGLQPDGRAYFAMKFIKGRTLSALMDSNPQGYDLLAVFEQVAQAMAYAHSRGVIHRDLKPANVMIGSFGEVIIVDWGFAKVLGLQEDKPKDVHTVVATVRSDGEGSQSMAGSVMGTPAYMPPEQAMGLVDELDERSDVFALGAILCEILTGEPPYTGGVRDQLLAASQARLDEAHARLDACDAAEEIKQIARDCMQPLGKDRPADAGVVAQRLGDHFAAVEDRARRAELETIEAEAAAERARSARRRTLVLAAVALVAIVGSGWSYFAWSRAREAQHADAERKVGSRGRVRGCRTSGSDRRGRSMERRRSARDPRSAQAGRGAGTESTSQGPEDRVARRPARSGGHAAAGRVVPTRRRRVLEDRRLALRQRGTSTPEAGGVRCRGARPRKARGRDRQLGRLLSGAQAHAVGGACRAHRSVACGSESRLARPRYGSCVKAVRRPRPRSRQHPAGARRRHAHAVAGAPEGGSRPVRQDRRASPERTGSSHAPGAGGAASGPLRGGRATLRRRVRPRAGRPEVQAPVRDLAQPGRAPG